MIKGHSRRASSFGSNSRPYLPSIDENEVASSPSTHSPPSPPLRIPTKSPRRALPPPAYIPQNRIYPPYTLPAPQPNYHEIKGKFIEHESMDEGSCRDPTLCGLDKRRGCCLLVIAVAFVAVVAIGLGVGLSLRHEIPTLESWSEPPQYPAGSFSFKTTLQNTSTECTSNPSTWRCFPYTQGSSATFFWIITSVNSTSYTISSSANPFAPSFTNLTLTPTPNNDRLQFSFSMNKTVVPDDKLSASNRAAECVFDDTHVDATLWMNGGEGNGDRFADWPGDVEIVQRKTFGSGPLECVDSDGGSVGDVRATSGACECRYANYHVD
ncbi:hypothetical protein F66182_10317 [Fusarium sp. NRRL 66182]|nr:hypothetical protein F66182_10317 [Fusarium sp. NRRL 66182]